MTRFLAEAFDAVFFEAMISGGMSEGVNEMKFAPRTEWPKVSQAGGIPKILAETGFRRAV